MEKNYKQHNSGHYLELADRLSVIMGNLDEYCYDHPASNDDIKKFIDEAMKNLWDAYQITGVNICEYSGLRGLEGYE
jgi:hypothetical protein